LAFFRERSNGTVFTRLLKIAQLLLAGSLSWPLASHLVPCEEQARLLTVYRAKVAAYSASVNDLTLTRGKILKEDYDRLADVAEKARTASEVARLALGRHTQSHGC
jgi:hypothetical protein